MTDLTRNQIEDYLGIKFDDEGFITLELDDINDLLDFAMFGYKVMLEGGKGGGK